MIIGIDASRAFVCDKTGTENYSYHLINEILRVPESKQHTFVLFIRPNAVVPSEISGYSNVIVKIVKMKYLWTQLGLAWETWIRHQIDVLWVPAHTLPVLRRPGLRTVVTIHGLEYQWLPEYKNLLQRWYLPLSTFYAAKSASALIAVSKFTALQLEKELHTSKESIKVIHEGVELKQISNHKFSNSQIEKVLERYGLDKEKYILFVGSVQPRKNLVALVEAFAHTQIEKLVIAGGIGWLAEEVLQAPSRYNVQERVVFTGRVSDSELSALYEGALMYVQPSITEGFGLPVLEAMAHGVPVISSDGGALREVVGEAGVIVKLTNIQTDGGFGEHLAKAMKMVFSDKKLQKKLINMGHKRVMDFTWEKAARESLAVILG